MKHTLTLLTFLFVLVGCSNHQTAPGKVDMHTSRNSLDWPGVYEGVLLCASCPGIATTLTLRSDNTYELQSQYLEREAEPYLNRGQLNWDGNGNVITVNFRDEAMQFAVNEGRLVLLNNDGTRPDPLTQHDILTRVGNVQDPASALGRLLENNRWTVQSALDAQGREIQSLVPSKQSNFILAFADGGVNVRGGCNSMRGRYEIVPSSTSGKSELKIGLLASTMMGCEPQLMEADAKLSAILSEPLQVELVSGEQSVLRLTTPGRQVLTLKGTPTPESLYGAPTTIFLEIAPQKVNCKDAVGRASTCLQVRERKFDQHGLKVGTPGEWRPLPGGIEGFEHTAGHRNIVRVKRYQRAGGEQSSELYVLDFVVESEIVR